jgi:type IV pilus assembly protein PilE
MRRDRIGNSGFTLIEILIVVAIVGLLLAVAIPSAMNAHLSAVETVVMREVLTIHQAQTQYQAQFGEYASNLAELGPPASGVVGPAGARIIPANLASGEKDGYRFTTNRTTEGYAIHADPKVFGKNGRRTFYMDQEGTLHQNWGPEPATENSAEPK